MMQPIQRVNVDFTQSMLRELDEAASELNVSRQAVIKVLVRQGLDRRDLSRQARRAKPNQTARPLKLRGFVSSE